MKSILLLAVVMSMTVFLSTGCSSCCCKGGSCTKPAATSASAGCDGSCCKEAATCAKCCGDAAGCKKCCKKS